VRGRSKRKDEQSRQLYILRQLEAETGNCFCWVGETKSRGQSADPRENGRGLAFPASTINVIGFYSCSRQPRH
jgi:hypothetical protein